MNVVDNQEQAMLTEVIAAELRKEMQHLGKANSPNSCSRRVIEKIREEPLKLTKAKEVVKERDDVKRSGEMTRHQNIALNTEEKEKVEQAKEAKESTKEGEEEEEEGSKEMEESKEEGKGSLSSDDEKTKKLPFSLCFKGTRQVIIQKSTIYVIPLLESPFVPAFSPKIVQALEYKAVVDYQGSLLYLKWRVTYLVRPGGLSHGLPRLKLSTVESLEKIAHAKYLGGESMHSESKNLLSSRNLYMGLSPASVPNHFSSGVEDLKPLCVTNLCSSYSTFVPPTTPADRNLYLGFGQRRDLEAGDLEEERVQVLETKRAFNGRRKELQ
ncbi:hypothetical protein AXF42_Ash006588 [Apostasia shenzhenica]|uniref:Uncharacterized protein n=1 Tax=Apostasia shenzhenica TaxID=1088818 RepID=A0A2I0AIT6_9ASPA|nr:hypothetical protein AXF42_Ash006588 [Apostasia shenzhenica]